MKSIIGEYIRKHRKSQRLTLEAVAGRTGLTLGYISQVELGHAEPTLSTVGKLAKALGLSMSDMFAEAERRTFDERTIEREWLVS